jgi:hypothetical protein
VLDVGFCQVEDQSYTVWQPVSPRVMIFNNDIAITSVCRQLYHETALLPFSLNRFRFDCVDYPTACIFLDQLNERQRGAISFVELYVSPSTFGANSLDEWCDRLPVQLPGLRKVSLTMESDTWTCSRKSKAQNAKRDTCLGGGEEDDKDTYDWVQSETGVEFVAWVWDDTLD